MRPIPTEACLSLVHGFEGSRGAFLATRARDPSGNWAIGWGHDLNGPTDPLWDKTLDAAEADELAIKDLTNSAIAVSATLTDVNKLTEGQYAACIDFAYNVGGGAFRGSTLAHFINIGNMAAVPDQFRLWVHARVNGVETVMAGLQRRREAEIAVWLT